MVTLGHDLPSIDLNLRKNSWQTFAVEFVPPNEETLDLSQTSIYIELDDDTTSTDLVLDAVVDDTAKTATWTISDDDSDYEFDVASGRMVAEVAGDRTVLLHIHATVKN